MPSPNNRRQLAASMNGFQDPQMNQFYQTYINKYHPGPDTPIPWGAFGVSQPVPPAQPPSILGSLGMSPSATAGQASPDGQGSNPIENLAMSLLMRMVKPEEYGVKRKKPSPQ